MGHKTWRGTFVCCVLVVSLPGLEGRTLLKRYINACENSEGLLLFSSQRFSGCYVLDRTLSNGRQPGPPDGARPCGKGINGPAQTSIPAEQPMGTEEAEPLVSSSQPR